MEGKSRSRFRVLIVDDDRDTREYLDLLLRSAGFAVTPCHDAAVALATLHESTPDAILIDYMLPGLSGVELCQELRKRPATAGVATVMYTACDSAALRSEAVHAGCDAFLTKPTAGRMLLACLRSAIAKRRGEQRDD